MGLAIDGGWKNDLLTRLKSHERDSVTFKPQCPEVNFDDTYFVSFKYSYKWGRIIEDHT